MVAEARTWVDVEGAVREWARDNVPTAARRVFFAANNDVTESQIVVQRLGGRDDNALLQWDIWAGSKGAAAALTEELCTAADALARYEHEGVLLLGAFIESVRWQPDAESNAARYIVDMTITAIASGIAVSS